MIPISLEMENFFAHSYSKVDFNFSSALVMGENGAGKSSILEGIAWALSGKSRYKHADDVVKRGRSVCKVILVFEHDNRKYKIIRTRNAKYASQNSLEFVEILSDGSEQPFKGDTNKELDKKIRDVIKSNYEVFINSSYFQQGAISEFMEGTSSQRQKIISSILNLDRWDRYAKAADTKYKELDKELSVLKYKLQDLKDIEKEIEEAELELNKKEVESQNLESEESSLNEAIKALEFKLSNIKMQDKNLSDYQDTKTKHQYVISKIEELSSACDAKQKLIINSENDIRKNEQSIEDTERQIAELSPILDLKGKTDIYKMESQLVRGKTKLEDIAQHLETLHHNDECFACGTIWSDEVQKKSKIKEKQEEKEALQAKIARAEEVLEKAKKTENRAIKAEVEVEKYVARCNNMKSTIQTHQLRIEGAQSELSLIKKSLSDYQNQKVYLEEVLAKVKDIFTQNDFEVIKQELTEKRQKYKVVSNTRDQLIYNIGALNHKLERMSDDKSKKQELQGKLEKVSSQAAIYNNLVRSFGRNGIQAIIVDNVMEELSKVTNNILSRFATTPTYVQFITQKKDTKGSWKETLDIEVKTPSGSSAFEGLSGGERFKVAFAIRLALSSIQARRMGGETQLLMLDEVSTCLDPRGLELFVSIIKNLEKTMKVMVITHDDKFKEEFDNFILVRKEGEDSEIEQF